jgi:hypothetical protein
MSIICIRKKCGIIIKYRLFSLLFSRHNNWNLEISKINGKKMNQFRKEKLTNEKKRVQNERTQ